MRLSAILVFIFLCGIGYTQIEADYQAVFAEFTGGETEVVLPDSTRVDVLTDRYAIEVDFIYKWYEAIGQSLYYALMTDREPAICLIFKDRANYDIYIERVLLVAERYHITVFLMEENFLVKALLIYNKNYFEY